MVCRECENGAERKGIIIVDDMPDMCINCNRSGYKNGIPYCIEKKKELDTFCYKPKWCPIKIMPQKYQVCGKYPQPGPVPSFRIGWNKCIDKILKGK